MLPRLKNIVPLAMLGLAVAVAPGTGDARAQDWKSDWDRTVEAAKKEGRLVLYMRRYEGTLAAFNRKYPEIKPVTITGEGSTLGARILSERRADRYLVDIYVGGPYTAASMLQPAGALDSIADVLVLPEVKDASKWVNGHIRYSDAERKYILNFLANPGNRQIAYNANLVKPDEVKSYRDLIDSKWKGKIVSLGADQRFIGATTQVMYYHPDLGPDYMKQLFGGMDITYAKNNRQMTDWLAGGKYAICIGCLYVEQAKQQGLPIDMFDTVEWKEGATFQAGSGSIALINRAPNPNAAKVFINWLLSREGQMEVQRIPDRGANYNSGRIDIPKDDVAPENRMVPGKPYFDLNNPEWSDIEAVVKHAKSIMATVNQ